MAANKVHEAIFIQVPMNLSALTEHNKRCSELRDPVRHDGEAITEICLHHVFF